MKHWEAKLVCLKPHTCQGLGPGFESTIPAWRTVFLWSVFHGNKWDHSCLHSKKYQVQVSTQSTLMTRTDMSATVLRKMLLSVILVMVRTVIAINIIYSNSSYLTELTVNFSKIQILSMSLWVFCLFVSRQ